MCTVFTCGASVSTYGHQGGVPMAGRALKDSASLSLDREEVESLGLRGTDLFAEIEPLPHRSCKACPFLVQFLAAWEDIRHLWE